MTSLTQDIGMAQFSFDQFSKVRALLRETAQAPEETFSDRDMAKMLTDELRRLREKGMSDEAISQLMTQKAGVTLPPEILAQSPQHT